MKDMKSLVIPAVIVTASFCSCGTTGGSQLLSNLASGAQQQQSTQTSGSDTQDGNTQDNGSGLLAGLLSGLLGSSNELSNATLAGTWKYAGTACVFESENLLLKAGGAVAANKITEQLDQNLEKIGIKAGNSSFTFNEDGSYTAKIAGRSLNGKYTLDAENKSIEMTYLAGLGKLTARITKSGNSVKLLFESDKLLQLLQGISALSGSTAGNTLSSLISSYDGLYIGLQLEK